MEMEISWNTGKEKQRQAAQTPNVVFVVANALSKPSNCCFAFTSMSFRESYPRGGTWDFKWRGWSKDFFGFEIFNSGIFWGTKIWQVFFLGSLIWVGIFVGYFKKESVVPWLRSPGNKVQTNVFCCCLMVDYAGDAFKQYCWNNTVDTKPFLGVSSTRSSMVKMNARWGKGYIQIVWWINKHECSISNVFLDFLTGHKIGMGFFSG